MKYLEWLVDTEERLATADGKTVQVLELCHRNDGEVLSDWAKHFRNHYCLDSEIDALRKSTGYSRAEYLNEIKFPDPSAKPGPSIRAGDFGEILIADYEFFGADRLLFGTDAPLGPQFGLTAETIESIERMDIPDFEKEKILVQNAVNLLSLAR